MNQEKNRCAHGKDFSWFMVFERFIKQCEFDALKDDGIESKEERALLNKLKKVSVKYVSELKKMC